MSSDRQSDGPSPEAERPAVEPSAALVRERGLPLLEALRSHLAGAGDHAAATASYAFAAAVGLRFHRARCELMREVARLHDIGKVYVPRDLLARPYGELDAGQRAQVDDQLEAGARLARGAGVSEFACVWMLHAGERYDGSGPAGLAGEAIPIESRIVRAACHCDAALSKPVAEDRERTEAGRRSDALAELRDEAGGALDPAVVDALAAILQRADTG